MGSPPIFCSSLNPTPPSPTHIMAATPRPGLLLSDRIQQLIQVTKGSHPAWESTADPDDDDVILESQGWQIVRKDNTTITNAVSSAEIVEMDTDLTWYAEYFYSKPHVNFVGKDKVAGGLVISVVKEGEGDDFAFRIRVLSQAGREHILIAGEDAGVKNKDLTVKIARKVVTAAPPAQARRVRARHKLQVWPPLRQGGPDHRGGHVCQRRLCHRPLARVPGVCRLARRHCGARRVGKVPRRPRRPLTGDRNLLSLHRVARIQRHVAHRHHAPLLPHRLSAAPEKTPPRKRHLHGRLYGRLHPIRPHLRLLAVQPLSRHRPARRQGSHRRKALLPRLSRIKVRRRLLWPQNPTPKVRRALRRVPRVA